jgi:hypothetical protein
MPSDLMRSVFVARPGRWVESVTLILMLTCPAGCSAGDEPHATDDFVEWVDSAGVRITANERSASEVPSVGPSGPSLVLGGPEAEGVDAFHLILAGRIRPDGSIVVADAGDLTVRVFSAEGDHLFSVGARGDGPGELRRIGSLQALSNGGLAVFDSGLLRVTVWNASGELIGTWRLPRSDGHPIAGAHLLSEGGALAVVAGVTWNEGEPRESGWHRDEAVVLHLDADFQVTDTIGRFPGSQRYYLARGDQDVVRMRIPFFAPRLTFAFSDRCVYAPVADEFSIGEFCAGPSSPQRRFDWKAAPLELSEAEWVQHALDAYERRAGLTVTPRRVLDDHVGEIPRTKPPAGQVLVDGRGNVWVANFHGLDEPASNWWVFGQDGALRLRFQAPGLWRILDVHWDRILAVERDEMDVERVMILPSPL